MHEKNCFVTLTYNNENLPKNGTLVKRDVQLFMKKLRKKLKHKIRYYYCGEYGEKFARPHYHLILFNHDFDDKKLWKQIKETRLYESPELTKIWGKGFCTVGDVTFESAAYVARYITKKVTGEQASDYYSTLDTETGELHSILSEFTDMSRRPGIGWAWFKKYTKDIFPGDFAVVRGRKMKPPKYYSNLLEIDRPNLHAEVKARRKASAKRRASDNTTDRLKVKEKIQNAKLKQLKRSYENEI